MPGYDCPAYSTFLNSSFYVSETTHTHVNSICLFEYDADYPIQRHSTSEYVSVTKNTYFAVRSVSTVGNYDYAFTYSFFRDGSIAVEVRASGYIQAAYYAHNEDYGFHIHDALSGSMHDHVLNFKADFDILGTQNSVQLVNQVPATKYYPWSGGKPRNTMTLQRSFVESEDEGRFDWAVNAAAQVLVVNQNATNAFGEFRGYRILPYTGTAHLTVADSSNLVNAARWAEHDIQVTRQKDTEPRSAYAYNTQDVNDPPVNFAKFFDGENLLQEDLVVWLNLGMHHVRFSYFVYLSLFFFFLFSFFLLFLLFLLLLWPWPSPTSLTSRSPILATFPTPSPRRPTAASNLCPATTLPWTPAVRPSTRCASTTTAAL